VGSWFRSPSTRSIFPGEQNGQRTATKQSGTEKAQANAIAVCRSSVAVRRNASETGRPHSREEEVASEPYELIEQRGAGALSISIQADVLRGRLHSASQITQSRFVQILRRTATQPLHSRSSAFHRAADADVLARAPRKHGHGLDQLVLDALMISLHVIVSDELANRTA
jgi:hypothetical protein